LFHVKQHDVSAHPTPPAPDVARGVFADRFAQAEALCGLLATDGIIRGLIGPREVPRLWDRHLLNCAVVTDLIPADATVCDIGSGAGLPGLVLAIRRPDLQITLIEPLLRRTSFLEEAVAHMGLANVTVTRARAEERHRKDEFDVVSARAVAPLDRLVGWALPLTRTGGLFLAMKGSSASSEIENATTALKRARGRVLDIAEVGLDVVDPPVRVVRIEKQ
jgi:16S rRNA (guanine527-N7)-methyltransferase